MPYPAHASTSFSWIELNWSASGRTVCSHSHCTTLVSNSEVGVSALYSSILGGCRPSKLRSNRPIMFRSKRRQLSATRSCACSGMPSRSEEHTSELQSLMRISYAVFCLKKNKTLLSDDIEHNTPATIQT